MTKEQAFAEGYMDKTAGLGDIISKAVGTPAGEAYKAGKGSLKYLLAAAAATPLIIGGAAGALQSNMTSPGKQDEENIQRELHELELQEVQAELRRRKKLDSKAGKMDIGALTKPERGLRL